MDDAPPSRACPLTPPAVRAATGAPAEAGRMHLALIFLAALVVRVAYWWGQSRHNPFFHAPIMDELVHHEWAQQLAGGAGLERQAYFRAPLYYYALAGLYALIGPRIAVARLLGGLLGACACVAIASLGERVAGRRVGRVAGALAAVYWPFVYFDNQLHTVGLEVFLNVAMLLLLVEAARRASAWRWGLAGLVWGLSIVTRPTVLLVAPLMAVWAVAARPPASRPRAAWRPLLLIALGALSVVAPVTLRNRLVGGEWVLVATNGGVNFYIGNNPRSDGVTAVVPGTRPDWHGGYEDTHRIAGAVRGRPLKPGEVSAFWYARARSWIRLHPLRWARLLYRKFLLFWSPVELPNNYPIEYFAALAPIAHGFWIGFPVVACLAAAGAPALWREPRRVWLVPGLYGLLAMGGVILFFCPARYRLPAVPALLLLAALGAVRAAEALAARLAEQLGRYRAGQPTRSTGVAP